MNLSGQDAAVQRPCVQVDSGPRVALFRLSLPKLLNPSERDCAFVQQRGNQIMLFRRVGLGFVPAGQGRLADLRGGRGPGPLSHAPHRHGNSLSTVPLSCPLCNLSKERSSCQAFRVNSIARAGSKPAIHPYHIRPGPAHPAARPPRPWSKNSIRRLTPLIGPGTGVLAIIKRASVHCPVFAPNQRPAV